MREDATTLELAALRRPRLLARARDELLQRHVLLELVRFGIVGASGYAVNFGSYALLVHYGGIEYHVSAIIAFVAGLINNFTWHRYWTFGQARDGHAGFQAMRFLIVSVIAFFFCLGILDVLVRFGGMSKLEGQAIANLAGAPLNFLANKLWSFRGD
jgi:dolichol-phosphate mannosyltransferase